MTGAGPGAWHHLRPRLMTRTVTLRPWQKAALERLAASTSPDFLAVATPGAGKTTFALTAARQAMAADPRLRLLVVVPTAHLKLQWAHAASAFDLHLDWQWSPAEGSLPGDMHGVVTTYQQVATAGRVLRGLAHNALVIFDELHHAAEERAWGDALREAFEVAPRRLALSGTPFRSDTHAIPFVRYHLDEAVPDYEYNYGDALADGGVVRPVYFPRVDGMMEWSAPDGSLHAHSFDDPLDAARAGQRLRTAYSVDGEWLPHVLRQAHERLLEIRRRQPNAGGLVIATDQEHAKGIARLLDRPPQGQGRRGHVGRPRRVRPDRPLRHQHRPVDRRRPHGGRGSRHPPPPGRRVRHHDDDRAVLPPGRRPSRALDPRLGAPALVPVHPGRAPAPGSGLRHRRAAPALAPPRRPRPRSRGSRPRRPSTASSSPCSHPSRPCPSTAPAARTGPTTATAPPSRPDDATLTIPLPPLPLAGRAADGRTRREHKAHLRKANADKGRLIAHHTGLTHAGVNAELNRVSGVKKISEATVEQLQRRLDKAEAWLLQASARRV